MNTSIKDITEVGTRGPQVIRILKETWIQCYCTKDEIMFNCTRMYKEDALRQECLLSIALVFYNCFFCHSPNWDHHL
jgi:hypothetical protein